MDEKGKKSKKYFVGLDIGTSSCGWAVCDDKYNLCRTKGQNMWGVRLFDEADTCADRRLKRTNRRRLDRKKLQLMWLREIFKPEMDKVDKNFFDRLKYSSLWEDDKCYKNANIKGSDSLFCGEIDGKKYGDKQYFLDYKTVYHLRQELTKVPARDIRFLYLAIHNIIKHRGHFLFNGPLSSDDNIEESFNTIIETLNDLLNEDGTPLSLFNFSQEIYQKLLKTIKENKGIRETKQEFCVLLNAKNKQEKAVVECFVDGKMNLKILFEIDKKIDFNSDDYLTILNELQAELEESKIKFLESVKDVYSIFKLKKILGDSNHVCESMIKIYDQHKEQLKFFKNFIRDFHKSKFFKMFRYVESEKGEPISNYPMYVNGSIFASEKQVINSSRKGDRTKEAFYKYVKTILDLPLEKAKDGNNFNLEDYENKKRQILAWIENDEFLPKQRTTNNSVLPNQIFEKELEQILKVNKEKFLFLNEKDRYGTNADKIIEILKFRVPYYVGPIKKEDGAHGWAERKQNLDYKPWTLEEIVDYDQAENDFISRMLNKCTYLKTENVLSKHSFLYSKFRVLNELNKLKIDGNNISVEQKQNIFNDLFCKAKKVTTRLLKEYLVCQNIYDQNSIKGVQISGIDKEFANNMASYTHFINSTNFGEEFTTKNFDAIEKVISYITIISDKTRLEKRIKREFGNILNDNQIKEIKGLNFSGWGNLSKEFLYMFFFNKLTGARTSIINEMWETNQNLQEIIFNSNYTLQEELEKLQQNENKEITYQNVEELYCSPSVKRAVWQTIKIINEIKNLMGNAPEKIFVEVTRHDEEKGENGRKLSRKKNLISTYQSSEFKSATNEMAEELTQLKRELEKKDDIEFRSEKLYLYFTQLGRCAYSGEKIDIQDLYDDNRWDIEHILPQSLIKDDSLNNKVLVKKIYNQQKDNIYPLYAYSKELVNKQKPFWKLLLDLKLMHDKKFDRLTRTEPLTDDEKGGFIERQIVETNQSAKAVIDLLKGMVEKPNNIVYSKAKFVNMFRDSFDIPKSRLVNDYHHAKDAYLNIVVGNIINNRFTNDPRHYYRDNDKNNNDAKTINIEKIFEHTIYSPTTGEIIWDGRKDEKARKDEKGREDKKRIQEICSRNDCLVSIHNFSRYNGEFYDETIYKKNKDLIPQKGNSNNPFSNPKRYGGYKSLSNAYFVVIEAEKKRKKIKMIEGVPILIYRKYKNSKNLNEQIATYLATENGLLNVNIVKKLNFKSTLLINGGTYLLGGTTGNQISLHNANEWKVDNKTTLYIKAIEKYIDMKKNRKNKFLEEIEDKVI